MSTYEFEQRGGTQRISGILKVKGGTGAVGDVPTQQANGDLLQAPGGGATPVQATYHGNATTVNDGDIGNLTWDTLVSGSELLDRTDPANPTFLADSFYALTVDVFAFSAFTAGGYGVLALGLAEGNITNTLAVGTTPEGSAAATFSAAIGDPIAVELQNLDGASARDFNIVTAILVKLA